MIRIEAEYNAYGDCKLTAGYPDGKPVSWMTFPGPISGTSSTTVAKGPFRRLRVRYQARKLRRLGERFLGQRTIVKSEQVWPRG